MDVLQTSRVSRGRGKSEPIVPKWDKVYNNYDLIMQVVNVHNVL